MFGIFSGRPLDREKDAHSKSLIHALWLWISIPPVATTKTSDCCVLNVDQLEEKIERSSTKDASNGKAKN